MFYDGTPGKHTEDGSGWVKMIAIRKNFLTLRSPFWQPTKAMSCSGCYSSTRLPAPTS